HERNRCQHAIHLRALIQKIWKQRIEIVHYSLVVLAAIREGGWRRFELEHFTVAAKAFFDLCLPLLTTRLIVALFVSAVFGVLGQYLSSGVINLVIDCRQLGVVCY